MSHVLRHLPLMILTAIMLCAVSCGNDEPRSKSNGSTPVPFDTTHRSDTTPNGNNPADTTNNGNNPTDTTNNGSNDTTAAFTITVKAPQDYGFMGQTMQLTAVTSQPAAVTWHSSQTATATVDANGLVSFYNTDRDGTTVITATANGVSDKITLTNRCWHVAARSGNAWVAPDYLNAQPGDTIILSIVDSQAHAINDNGFNAGACQWSIISSNASIESIVKTITKPTVSSNWQYILTISPDAPQGAIFIALAQYGNAASALQCAINR